MAEKVTYSLDNDLFDVIAYIDKNPEFWGKRFINDRPIIAPSEIVNYEFDILIIAVSMFEEEIKKYMSKYVEQKKMITFLPNYGELIWADERYILARKCCELIKERKIKGNIAEVGVYKGDFSRLLNGTLPDRTIYLFDTFEGFAFDRDTLDVETDKERFKDTCVEHVINNMKHPDKCIIKKGYFPDTANDVEDEFCFVSLDCDLYEPTISGLEFFYPRLNRGGYIFVHDFGHNHYGGVRKAVYEFIERYPQVSFVPIVDRGSSVVIAK